MKQKSHSGWWRNPLISQFAWLGAILQHWRNPWLAGLWLSVLVAAVILSVVPGDWVSLTRHFPGLSSSVADVIEPLSHFLGFAVLVGFASVVCHSWTNLIIIYVAGVLIGVMLETVQVLIPERGASFSDLSMNVLGASAGFVFGAARLKRSTRVSIGGQGR